MSPQYPVHSPLEDVLRLVRPGSDEYITELYASEIETVLARWSQWLAKADFSALRDSLTPSFQAASLIATQRHSLRSDGSLDVTRHEFSQSLDGNRDRFISDLNTWLEPGAVIKRADFEIVSIRVLMMTPLLIQLEIRYDALITKAMRRTQRVGSWVTEWQHDGATGNPSGWKISRLRSRPETVSSASSPVFVDVSEAAFDGVLSYEAQMLHGADHWRSILDGACGIDIYGNNGIAAGDFDNDGHDDLYVSQAAGLPNRLYRNRGDGTFEDVTGKAGVGVLDNTSCALFADLRNSGLQDLLVVCGSGPLLFINQGDGTFRLKPDAFKFTHTPQGTFTHAAISDYDLDGRLDIYFCVYSYYLGLDQYHYPVPYFDARNGPPNFLFHNEGDAVFTDATAAAGLNIDNDRYSFACAWGPASEGSGPDLYVVNDFGRNVLYRSKGNGTFTVTSSKAQAEDVGAGMSACWTDTTNSGRSDLYAANMWSAAGQRVSDQSVFHPGSTPPVRELYRRHADGNALYLNQGDGTFHHAAPNIGVDAGRWAWCSDSWDFDHDGYADLYVTNGYITSQQFPHPPETADQDRPDLGSFFWRQVVAKSPDDSTPSLAYEHGWNALNELIRSDNSWSGSERNVMFANNRDGTFSEVSGAVGLDFVEDGRSFALADFDGDGRLEIAVKNRNAPQLRLLHNQMASIGDSLAVRLEGTKSNRDAIGTSITIELGGLRQKKSLQAGSGFLAQHSKETFFGLGKMPGQISATVRWPGGLIQRFENLPRNHRISFVEGQAAFSATPFARSSLSTQAVLKATPTMEQTPSGTLETWLIDTLKAPEFTLQTATGQGVSLSSFFGRHVLLQFCSRTSEAATDSLTAFQKGNTSLKTSGLQVLVLLVDDDAAATTARTFAQRLSFPVLMVTERVAGIYNIMYRYLFDRRRDLPLPCAFLLDQAGMIVKLYQGAVGVPTLVRDVSSIPLTTADRLRKGLPFAGSVYQGEFVRNDFTYGVAMFQHGYLDQAEDSFQQVVLNRPDSAEGFYNLGTLNLRKKNFLLAKSYLQQSLKLKADYPEAWNNLGMMAAQEGRTDEAIQNFKESLQYRPTYATALLNLGNAYRRQGDKPRAKDALTGALSLQPDDPEVNYSLGLFYAQAGELQPAETFLRKAIAIRPVYPEAMNNLGILLIRRQDYQQAEKEFNACILIAPDFDQSYLNLAKLYMLQHNRTGATAAVQSLLKRKPDSVSAREAMRALETIQ